MDGYLDDLRLLSVALREGSLSAAARRLGMAQATVSRRVAALERRIGHALVVRSRGGLALTTAGERLRPHLQALDRAAAQVSAAVDSIDERPRGRVRVALPPGVAVDLLIPLLPDFRARFPEVSIDVVASAHVADLDGDQADLAIRFVRPTSGDLVCRRLGSAQWSIQAAPELVALLPSPPSLTDIPWITWPKTSSFAARRWLDHHVPGVVPALESDDFLVQREAAFAGLGAVLHGQTHGLVAIDVPVRLPEAEVYLVIRRSLVEVPRVRAVADALVERARSIPALSA